MPRPRKQDVKTMSNSEIAHAIKSIRVEAHLTQQELGELIGTTASSICRLEDARYKGHSVAMLRRIAAVVNKSVEIRFVSASGAVEV